MTSTPTADTLLRQAWLRACGSQAGGLAVRALDRLLHVCLGLSRLHAPVSHGVLTVSSRTLVNNAGWVEEVLRRKHA